MDLKVFGKNYSNNYDLFYDHKDYKKECDYLESLFHKYGITPTTILDLGCGTGAHLIELTKRGYITTGIDQSKHMLDLAKEKSIQEGMDIEYIQGDITNFNLNRKFDVVISMFAVASYLTENEQFESFSNCAYDHLNCKGLLIFDCWSGPAALTHRPSERLKKITNGDVEILRFTQPILRLKDNLVETHFEFLYTSQNEIILREEETHMTRYFFPKEIDYFMKKSKFKAVNFHPFMSLDQNIDDYSWYITTISHKE